MYEIGKTEDNPKAKGVAILIHSKMKDCIANPKIYSNRVIKVDINLERQDKITVIMVYAPTSSASEAELDQFYETVEAALTDTKARYKVLIGDFNAKIGVKTNNEPCQSLGLYGIGVRNDRGDKLIEFAEEHKLVIANTLFKKAKNRYWTWESPDGITKNMIDFALCNKREILVDCGVITQADKGSDHRMIRTKIKINKRLARVKTMNKLKPLNFDLQKLNRAKEEFQLNLKNRFDALKKETDIDTFTEILKEEAKKLASRSKDKPPAETPNDKEIRELDEKRKRLRNVENKSDRDKIEYAEIKKTVKKKRRIRARRKRKEHIEAMLENNKGPKDVMKAGQRKIISEMRDSKGETKTDQKQILGICAQFYQDLYSTQKQQENRNKETNHTDNTKVPLFMEAEIEKALKEMKKNKSPGNDQLTSDMIRLGGSEVLKQITTIFNNILLTQKIPPEWKEAKIIILFKKGDRKDIKNYRPISLLSHMYKLFTRVLQKRMERVLDYNQPREQAGFRKGFSTTDHLQTINQIMEKCNEFNIPLCLAFIDYEKAFDSVEHWAIFEALRNIGIHETYVKILIDIYTGATAKIHLENQISETIKIQRGVRQGDPISPKLFTAAIEEVFKKAELEQRGMMIDGESLTDLRFADDVVTPTIGVKNNEAQLNIINEESKKIGLAIHRGKTKFIANFSTDEKIFIEGIEIEKVESYKYLGQTISVENRTLEEVLTRIKMGWSVFYKYREIFLDKDLPMSLKRKVYNQCVIPTLSYGAQTWSLTKEIVNKISICQRAMERKMLGIKLQDKIPNKEIREKTKLNDILEVITRSKWKWAGHVARMSDNRWTIRSTEWQVREGKRSRGRPKRRWQDDICQYQGASWARTAKDRKRWRNLVEGYFQQWKDLA